MGAVQTSMRSWGRVLALISGAVVSMGLGVPAANAEGVVNGGLFTAGGVASAASLIDSLGDAQLESSLASDVSRPETRVSPRPASLRERTETKVGGDIFRNSRLALPLIVQSAIGSSPEEALAISSMRPMTGPMVGLRPHPRTWGSTLDR